MTYIIVDLKLILGYFCFRSNRTYKLSSIKGGLIHYEMYF